MNLKLLPLLILLPGCSVLVEEPRGVAVVCHAPECPPQSEVAHAVEFFAEAVEGFTPGLSLDVHWYAPEVKFYGGKVLGYTESDSAVHVTNQRLLIHELFHVHFWRAENDPDATHEEGDGPWLAETNERIRDIELALEAEQASVSECLGLPSEP